MSNDLSHNRRHASRGTGPAWRAAFLVGACVSVAIASAQSRRLTLEMAVGSPSLTGTAPSSPVWSPDSQWLAFLWNDGTQPGLDVWIAPASGGAPRRVTDLASVPAGFAGAPPAGRGPGPNQPQQRLARARGSGDATLVWTRDAEALLLNHVGQLWRVPLDGSGLTRLTPSPGPKLAAAMSPDGRAITFLQNGDLFLQDLQSGELTQATRDSVAAEGSQAGASGQGFDAQFIAYKWSPSGRHIALQFNDNRNVRQILVPNYLAPETEVLSIRRGYPGDEHGPVQRIALYAVDGRQTAFARLPATPSRTTLTFDWSPDGRHLIVDQASFDAVHRWIYLVNTEDASVRELWHDERATRVTVLWNSAWQSDSQGILFISDHEGRHRLYAQPIGGGAPKLLTPGEYSVVGDAPPSVLSVAPGSKTVFFVTTRKNPYERQVYRVAQAGGEVAQVTTLAGTHLPFASPDGTKVAVLHSNDVTPTDLYVVEAAGGSPERRITRSPRKEFDAVRWVQPRYVTFKSRTDGVTLHGRLIEPRNLDRSKKYPVILGPVYRDRVRNKWDERSGALQQYLTIEGEYISFQVDVRGSNGYGRDFREQILKRYGEIDIDDLQSGVEYLKTLPYIDPDRIGIWGSSYGGLMTVLSVFKKPGVYKAAVAGAPATNTWHATSTHVRLGRDPKTDPENYLAGSAITYGENLQDRLMIIHGMMDDTVLFQDSVVLVEKLMSLRKNFDFVAVPSASHAWSQRDYHAVYTFTKLVEHFDRYLGRGGRPATGTAPDLKTPGGAPRSK